MLLPESASSLNKPTLLSALRFLLLVTVPIALLIFVGNQLDRHYEVLHWQKDQAELVTAIKAEVDSHFYSALTDLQLLANHHGLFANTRRSNAQLAEHLLKLGQISRSYSQLRFIGVDGKEIVRINYSDGEAKLIAPEQLQNKAHRTYFQAAVDMRPDEVYISRFDLNIEHHQIEQPPSPVIRYATPVFDERGDRTGILVLNLTGQKLLHRFDIFSREKPIQLYLLNEQGWYLFSDRPDLNWGFQLAGRPRFGDSYPEWQRIVSTESGSLVTANGLFTFDCAHKLKDEDRNWMEKYTTLASTHIVAGEPPWRIVSVATPDQLYSGPMQRLQLALVGLALLMLPLIPTSIIWGKSRASGLQQVQRNRIYAQVVNQANELIYITDADGLILYANPATSAQTGYSAEEIIGNTPRLFRSGRHSAEFYRELWKTLKDGKQFDGIIANRKKDGTVFYEAKTITPLRDEHGDVRMFVSTGKDISADRSAHEREMNVFDCMARGVSHHFGNMLNAISGYGQLALEESPELKDSPAFQHISQMLASSRQAEKLLNNIRTISSVTPTSLQALDLRLPVEGAVISWKEQVQSPITVAIHQPDTVPFVMADPYSVEICIHALLSNALEAMDIAGKIDVGIVTHRLSGESCSSCHDPLTGDYIEVYVKDTGSGITREIQERIWDPFFTTKESANLVGVTPGLGLSGVRAIVHCNKGHIIVDSKGEGQGTTVRLLFPVPDAFA